MENKELYLELIDQIDKGFLFSMCPTLIGTRGLPYNPQEPLIEFPELAAQKPEELKQNELWFPVNRAGMKERKECLLKALALC